MEITSTKVPHLPPTKTVCGTVCTFQTDSTGLNWLPVVVMLNVVPGVGVSILKNASTPPRAADGLG